MYFHLATFNHCIISSLRRDCAPRRGLCPGSFCRYSRPLLLLHSIDQLKQLASIHHLYERCSRTLAADYVQGGSVLETELDPTLAVGVHQGRECSFGVNHKWQIDLVRGGKLLRERPERVLGDLQLMREDGIAELVADRPSMRIEDTREARRTVGPGVHRERQL